MSSRLVAGLVLLVFLSMLSTVGYLRSVSRGQFTTWQFAWRWVAMLAALYLCAILLIVFPATLTIVLDLPIPDGFFVWLLQAMAAPFIWLWQLVF